MQTLLISSQPPVRRAAYSDRTACIMAELSRLVYERLPAEDYTESLIKAIKDAVKHNCLEKEVRKIAEQFITSSISPNQLSNKLKEAKCELVDSFAESGTDGMVVAFHPQEHFKGMLVIVFRGTERKSEDVIINLKAQLFPAPGGGCAHKGFLDAYDKVSDRLKSIIAQYSNLPVYITGHSLGGALAMIATRYLQSDQIGATYTYGCPRVADDEFYKAIKSPVYRIVNASDAVARLPFGFTFNILLTLIRLIPVNGTKVISEWLRRKFSGYTHFGCLVFINDTHCSPSANSESDSLTVKHSPDIFWRIAVVIRRIIKNGFKITGYDHRIKAYSKKLLRYAEMRNRQ